MKKALILLSFLCLCIPVFGQDAKENKTESSEIQIVSQLEKQNALIERQNELLEKQNALLDKLFPKEKHHSKPIRILLKVIPIVDHSGSIASIASVFGVVY